MKSVLDSKFEYFLKCAHEGSFLKASKRIGLSQPALSSAMKKLETELGVTLFERSVHGVRLTAAGEGLNAELTKLQKELQPRLDRAMRADKKTLLRMGCVGHLASKYLLTILERKRKILPTFHLYTSTSLDCYEEVLRGGVEFAFVSWSSRPKRLKSEYIAKEVVEYVGLKKKFAHIENIQSLDELRKQPWVDLPKPQKDWTKTLEETREGYLARDVRILRDIVLRGLAVGSIQMSFFSQEEKKRLVKAAIPSLYPNAAVYAIFRKDLSRESKRYLNLIVDTFKEATCREPTG